MPSYEDIFQYSEVGQSSVTELLVGLFLPLKQFLAFFLGAEERKKTEKHEKKKKKRKRRKVSKLQQRLIPIYLPSS